MHGLAAGRGTPYGRWPAVKGDAMRKFKYNGRIVKAATKGQAIRKVLADANWSALDALAGYMDPRAVVSSNGYSAQVYVCIDDPEVPTLDVVVPSTGNAREDGRLRDNLVSGLSSLGGRFDQVDLPFGGGDVKGTGTQVSLDLRGISYDELGSCVSSLFKAVRDALDATAHTPPMPAGRLADAVEGFMSDTERFQDFEDDLMDVVRSAAFHAVQDYLGSFEGSAEAEEYLKPDDKVAKAAEELLRRALSRRAAESLSHG